MSRYKSYTIRTNRESLKEIYASGKGYYCEVISKFIYIKCYMTEQEQIKWLKTEENQQYGDFAIFTYKHSDTREVDEEFDFYFLESKTAKLSNREAKLFCNMAEYKTKALPRSPREPYRQHNTGTNIGWSANNSQPRVLTAYCIEKRRLYIFKNWRKLSLALKWQYTNIPIEKLELPFDRQLNVPDYSRSGEVYKYSDCMILHLDQMNSDFMEKYEIDIVDVNFILE